MSDEPSELYDQPVFERGDKVIAAKAVRNDGTFPGASRGEFLIRKGEVGYVHSVGTYLNRFYIYSIDFIECGKVVGMRANELTLAEAAPPHPDDVQETQPRGIPS